MGLANEIKILRKKTLMTQENFARELGVSFSTVNRWEAGKTRPNMTAMKRITSFCDNNGISSENLRDAFVEQAERGK